MSMEEQEYSEPLDVLNTRLEWSNPRSELISLPKGALGFYLDGALYRNGKLYPKGKLHVVGMDDVLFRCAVCGGEWLFNPLMFIDDPDPEKQAIIFCSGRIMP